MSIFAASDRIRDKLKPYYLLTYRGSAFTVITAALVFAFCWGLVLLFFMFNRTWVAPAIMSRTSDKMLTFNSGYQTAYQTVETLKVARSQAQRDIVNAENNSFLLHKLEDSMGGYVQATATLGTAKSKDLVKSYALGNDLDKVKALTEQSIKAGLITKSDASQTFAGIQQFNNSTTDGNISLQTMKITVQSQIVQLMAQIGQADSDVITKKETFVAADNSLVLAQFTLKNLQDTSYYKVFKGGAGGMVFIPYDNFRVAKVGASVYDCYLMIIACHKIGTIRHIYSDDILIEFPLFNIKLSRTARGVFADVDVVDQKDLYSSVMFIGKPLFL